MEKRNLFLRIICVFIFLMVLLMSQVYATLTYLDIEKKYEADSDVVSGLSKSEIEEWRTELNSRSSQIVTELEDYYNNPIASLLSKNRVNELENEKVLILNILGALESQERKIDAEEMLEENKGKTEDEKEEEEDADGMFDYSFTKIKNWLENKSYNVKDSDGNFIISKKLRDTWIKTIKKAASDTELEREDSVHNKCIAALEGEDMDEWEKNLLDDRTSEMR